MRICRFQNIGLNMCAHAGAFCKHIKHCCKTSIFYTPTVKSCYFMNISSKELHVWPLMAQKRFSAFTEQNKSWKPDVHTLIKHAFLTAITCVSNQLLQCLSNGQADTRKQTCFDQMLFVQLCRKYFVCSKQQEKTYYQHSSCVIIYLWWTCKQSAKYIDCFFVYNIVCVSPFVLSTVPFRRGFESQFQTLTTKPFHAYVENTVILNWKINYKCLDFAQYFVAVNF